MSRKLDSTKIVIVATHDEKLVKKICNRVFKMEKGNINEIPVNSIVLDYEKIN